jgi:hypothetical protein
MASVTDTARLDNLAAATPVPTDALVIPYEERLNQDRRWALSEGSLFFEGQGKVQKALQRITQRLNELGIAYAVADGMAMFQHGYRRFTEDVDILVTPDGLEKIHEALDGLGYIRPFSQSKNLRDTDAGVRIDFLTTGQFPGDGKPKPIAFPDPVNSSVELDGMHVLTLSTLLELKLASGLTGAGRRKDLGDAQELIKFFRLPAEYSDRLNAYVQPIYLELWNEIELEKSPGGPDL